MSKKKKDVKVWDLLNPKTEYVADDIKEKRYSICQTCTRFIKISGQCKECGCFMAMKTGILHASCPLGKW